MSYTGIYDIPNYGLTEASQTINCAGTLITKQVVMTAAHCVLTSFEYNITNETIVLPVVLNKIYPSYASMFKIYAGADDLSFLDKTSDFPEPPIVAVNVSYVLVVSLLSILQTSQ